MRFPDYKVLRDALEKFPKTNVTDWYIISVQHIMESTGSLFETFIAYGFLPNKIFLTGKIYSTHTPTANKLKELGINYIESTIPNRLGAYSLFLETDVKTLWSTLEKQISGNSKIIILDDGGYTLKNVPIHILDNYNVFGIEQTTSGIRMQKAFGNFPVIHLAASAAKVIIEPPIVSEAIQIRLGEEIRSINPQKVGIIGFGNIGKAIAQAFKESYNLYVYDLANPDQFPNGNFTWCDSIIELYEQCDLIIGATGQDISDLSLIENSVGNKILISVSSGDVEFNRLLKFINSKYKISDPLSTIKIITNNNHILTILRGGLVANFTGAADSSPGHIIQMTRGLLFAAVMQIVQDEQLLHGRTGPIMLNPSFQSTVVSTWFQDQPQRITDYTEEVIRGFKNLEWIKQYSDGKYLA